MDETSNRWDRISELVQRSRSGDQESFRELLESHRSAVTSTLFACGVRCEETARDLAQDVAIKAWTRLGTLKEPRTFSAWIRRIAANAARDELRRTAVRREDALEQATDLAADDDPLFDIERMAEIRFMLAAMADEDEEVVRLLVARANGVGMEALAEEIGVSVPALKMRLMRARKRLRTRLDDLRKG